MAAPEAFASIQGKLAFAELLDRLGLPQPGWAPVRGDATLPDWPYPYLLKAPFSTAGLGVRRVADLRQARAALVELSAGHDHPVMAQQTVAGRYAQVPVVADRGRLVAAHTSAQTAGGGGPERGRPDQCRPPAPAPARGPCLPCAQLARWTHARLLLRRGRGQLPRVRPGDGRAGQCRSGVDLPDALVRLSLGEPTAAVGAGRTGVRTHSALAVLLGTAARTGSRRGAAADLVRLATRTGTFRGSVEGLTPVLRDPPSLVPLLAVLAQVLVDPARAGRLASVSVANYSVTEEALRRLGREPPGG